MPASIWKMLIGQRNPHMSQKIIERLLGVTIRKLKYWHRSFLVQQVSLTATQLKQGVNEKERLCSDLPYKFLAHCSFQMPFFTSVKQSRQSPFVHSSLFPLCPIRLRGMEYSLPSQQLQYTLHRHLSIVSLVNSGFDCSRRDRSFGGLYRKIEFYPNSWIALEAKGE